VSVPGVAIKRERIFPDAVTGLGADALRLLKVSLMVSGKHPIAGLRPLKQDKVMTSISRFPLSPSQQALLAEQDGSLQTPLTEVTSVAGKLGPSDEPAELKTEVEDCPNNGIGE